MNTPLHAGREAKLSWLDAAAFAPWLAAALYWNVTYTGPYRWLSEWQMRHWGEYLSGISAMIPALLGWGATVLVLRLIPGTLRWRRGDAQAGARTAVARFDAFLGAPQGALAIFLACVGLALYVRHEAASYGPLRRVTADYLAGPAPGRWVEVTGWPDERGVSQTTNGSEHVYIGLRDARGADAAALVPVFVKGRPEELAERVRRNDDGSVTVQGLVRRSMEAPVRHYLEAQGVTMAPDPWVLHPHQSPAQQARSARLLVVMGAVVSLVVWLRFRKRGTEREAS